MFTLAKNGQISLQRPPRPATPRLFRWAQSYGNLSKGVWEGHTTIVRALATPKAQIHPQQHITINAHILKFQRTGSTGLLLLLFLGRGANGILSRATPSSRGGSAFASDHACYRVTCQSHILCLSRPEHGSSKGAGGILLSCSATGPTRPPTEVALFTSLRHAV